MIDQRKLSVGILLSGLFSIGFLLMGYEMLGSRYLNPYFGSGITTWACLISVVLLAMMLGYFAGGFAVDARPGVGLLVICAAASGLSLLVVPLIVGPLFPLILQKFGDGFWGVLLASTLISFLPVALMSACSPFVVRLLLVDLAAGGRISGVVYSVSTLGNVIGTLVTTFILIPNFGVRTLTYFFGVGLILVSVAFHLVRARVEAGLRGGVMVGVMCILGVAAFTNEARAESRKIQALYPEGPIWVGPKLLYAEMGADRVTVVDGAKVSVFWSERGCGPTAVAVFKENEYIVLCHLKGALVHLSADGRKLGEYMSASDGERLRNPNDCHTDFEGGVIFGDAGVFSSAAPASGKIFRLAPDGSIKRLLEGLHYANGVAFAQSGRKLLVSEHLARRVWSFVVTREWKLTDRQLFLDVGEHLPGIEKSYPEAGPDGIEFDLQGGTVLVPVYGAGTLLVVDGKGSVSKLRGAPKFITNVAASENAIVVVGAFVNDSVPLVGQVEIVPRAEFYRRLEK